MNENFDAFDKYAMQFDMNEKMIEYKYNHSYRVVHQAEEICRSLNMDTVERDLASNIALLHDIARFKQWTDYKTFHDEDSFDHGDMAVTILFDEGKINDFIIDKDDYEVVKKAVANHNKYKVDTKGMNEREKLHCDIVRDADKIDILYAFSTNRLLELKEDDSEINPLIKKEFFKDKQVLSVESKTQNDRIVSLFGLVFDLNYEYSINRVLEEKYLEKMLDHLNNKKLFKPYIDEAIKYMKGRLKNDRKKI